MIREDIRQLKTGSRDLRKFGLMVGGVFLLLGCWFLYRHKSHYPWFLWPGVALFGLGLVAPITLRYVYIGWMTLAFVLGFIVSNILLTLFFYLIVTPIGLLARCLGKDFLERKLHRESPSYWLPRDRSRTRDVSEYERQF